jgi:signal transduction histidine kinase
VSHQPSPDDFDIPSARLSVFLRAALDLANEHDLGAVLAALVERACDLAGARYGALGIYDDQGNITEFVHRGLDAATVTSIGQMPQGHGLLGEVIAADAPTRLTDLMRDPRACGFPANHPPMHSFLGVPVRSGHRRHGNLYLTDKRDGDFDDTDERLIVALARFAAAAIDNALLVEAERQRSEAFALLTAAERRNRAQHEMLERVIDAQEAERARVARDLHDQIGQSLTSILLAVGVLDRVDPASTEARHRHDELRELVTGALDEVRDLAFQLRPTILDDIGLVAALDRLVQSYRNRGGSRVDLSVTGLDDNERLRADLETAIYRIVQESLTNVARHASAELATVDVHRLDTTIQVDIADNGRGFDPSDTRGTLGVSGMLERAALVGAVLTIESQNGEGARVHLEVPLG